MDIHDFMRRVSKPMYVFRMARGHQALLSHHHYPQDSTAAKSAGTRVQNAVKEIEDLVLAYAADIQQQRDES